MTTIKESINNANSIELNENQPIAEEIYWADEECTKLELDYYPDLKKFYGLLFSAGVLTLIFHLYQAFCTSLFFKISSFETIILLFNWVLFIGISFWSAYSVKHRKSNSVFLGRSILYYILGTWVVSFLVTTIWSSFGIMDLFGLLIVYWVVKYILISHRSDEFISMFPKMERSTGVIAKASIIALAISYVTLFIAPFFV